MWTRAQHVETMFWDWQSHLHKVVILEFIVMGILLTERFGKSQV